MDSQDEFAKLQAAWQMAFAGAHSEIIIEDLNFYAKRQAHVPNDPYTTAFNDGMRTMATNILIMIEGNEHVPRKTKVRK